jgi:excisionase family DNA binding protein
MSDARWLSVREAAETLGVAAKTVYDMAEKNAITHYRLGAGRGRIAFRPADVEAFIESRKVEAGADKAFEIKASSRHLRPPSPSRRPS